MNERVRSHGRIARWVGAASLLAAGAVGGGLVAGALSANAATNANVNSTSTTAVADGNSPPTPTNEGEQRAGFPPHGTAAHEALEKPVTGSNATKAKAVAVKAVGSGTAGAVTTDASGNGYEVTVTKSDGSKTEIHLDQSFDVIDHGRPGR
ncbi:hypothetical protein SAMN05421678_101216 [Actinopolymorpha cephalotaxi]|uniref:Nicotinic acid phosphoribosyltransferase n=1 Tax=Actinopolymorpha cephalotaxi TaxID=504797 RepID=A0A1I2KF88_9ACTN|nr:hypothetical protein [Actinopolymorpha cephalotaxi]NYH87345.1 nicotinic acid phosphoribosyltransferase [Actinopolymorpha cephalotaxi]SFF64890.1 hypothetical protein SAMN05421678_101216 [Actinopolymorpha cephalotaxi]